MAVRRNSSRSAETRGRGRGFFIISGTREERRIVVECYVRDAAVLILDSFTKHVVISRSRLGNVVCYYASYNIIGYYCCLMLSGVPVCAAGARPRASHQCPTNR